MQDYLEKLNEAAEEQETKEKEAKEATSGLSNSEGLILPDENKKIYNWLKKEYNAGQTEVKVEINMGGAKFEPGYEMQTDLKSVKDFKPGMFGEVKTVDSEGANKDNKPGASSSPNLEKGGNPNVNTAKPAPARPGEAKPGEKTAPATATPGEKAPPFTKKGTTPETSDKKPNINNNKEEEDKTGEEKEKTGVKKVDLKTKKK